MAIYRNATKGGLFFGRFKLKAWDAVPCVDFTDTEQADIERFLKKGILVEEKTETSKAKEKVVEVAPVEEAPKEPKSKKDK